MPDTRSDSSCRCCSGCCEPFSWVRLPSGWLLLLLCPLAEHAGMLQVAGCCAQLHAIAAAVWARPAASDLVPAATSAAGRERNGRYSTEKTQCFGDICLADVCSVRDTLGRSENPGHQVRQFHRSVAYTTINKSITSFPTPHENNATSIRTAAEQQMGAPRPLLLCAFLFLCTACLAAASDNPAKRKRWRPEDFPNPQKDLLKCGRRDGVKSSLCDPEDILTPQQHNMVDGLVNEIASGAAPFKTAACGAAGQQGFQVRRCGKQCACIRMCMHARCCSRNTPWIRLLCGPKLAGVAVSTALTHWRGGKSPACQLQWNLYVHPDVHPIARLLPLGFVSCRWQSLYSIAWISASMQTRPPPRSALRAPCTTAGGSATLTARTGPCCCWRLETDR